MSGLSENDFFDLAYAEYTAELQLAYSLPQRVAFAMTAEVVVAGAAATIARIDLIHMTLENWRVFVLHLATFFVMASLLGATAFAIRSIWPRDYPKLGKLFFWAQWRSRYRATLESDSPNDVERNQRVLAAETLNAILGSITDAQSQGAFLNQLRLAAFERCVFCLALAVVCVAIQALAAFVVHCEVH